MDIKQMGRIAEFYLEEAVLAVLVQAHRARKCIGPAEISRRAGIFREPGAGGEEIKSMNDAIVTGILVKLHRSGKVERCQQSANVGGWKVTDEEFDRRANHED